MNMEEQPLLYVLKHKDLDVAMVQIDAHTGKIDYVLEVYLPGELPVGCGSDGNGLMSWWEQRAIPDTRRGIQETLRYLGEESSLSLMLAAYGLSLNDHYWMQPINRELYWKDINFFENPFSDELGNLLTETEEIAIDDHISKFSPASSVNGEMKKKWVIEDGIRYLMKVSTNHYGQQSVNEVIATRLHECLGWDNYAAYELRKAIIENQEYPCSLCRLFTSEKLEFVSGYQLIRNYKVANESSVYETMIQQAGQYGISEEKVRRQLEYTILTDFILSNTDRHFNNFGFLYDAEKREFISMAPIFDTGNALFYEKEFIPTGENLLDIHVASFTKKEVELLRYVQQKDFLKLERLDGFSKEAERLLKQETGMPGERAEKIAQTIDRKIEYLRLFQDGKKIWKRKAYW